jgi:hypothetical protein
MGSNKNTTSHTAPKRASGRGKAVQSENQLNPTKNMSDALKTVNARIERHIDLYSDAMDSKFEIIDNDKTQEIVFLRQSHDLADCVSLYFSDLKTHSPLLGKILETQAANEALQKELDELKSAAAAGAHFGTDLTNRGGDVDAGKVQEKNLLLGASQYGSNEYYSRATSQRSLRRPKLQMPCSGRKSRPLLTSSTSTMWILTSTRMCPDRLALQGITSIFRTKWGWVATPTIVSNIWQSWYIVFQIKIIT